MRAIVKYLKKQNALIISRGDNQSTKKPGITLATMANIVIHNLTKQSLDQYEYSFRLVKISPINLIPLTKYALRRGDCFPTI